MTKYIRVANINTNQKQNKNLINKNNKYKIKKIIQSKFTIFNLKFRDL